jgi:uncharacterized protein (TIGR03085 family)
VTLTTYADSVTNHVAAERAALADLLTELGPDAPTLCTGWTTYDLAAHLVIRERIPSAWPGIALPRLAGRTERVQREFKAEHPYPECVQLVRQGPPVWLPHGAPVLGEAINLLEYTVHHEDVRRAQPGWVSRAVPTDLADAVWGYLRVAGRLMLRRVPVGVVLHRSGTDARIRAKRGEPTVEVTGDPIEVALYAFNRRSVARVDLHGDETAVARLAAAQIGP